MIFVYCWMEGVFMTYFQFIHAVETKVKKEVKEERKISVHTNIKNNGLIYD